MSECHNQEGLPSATQGTPLHLLLVEDSAFDAELIILTLERSHLHFTYDIAETIPTCRDYLNHRRYDVVLSDYRLLGFTAYETLKLLQESKQEIPLILVTGTLGEEAAVECIKAGITDYVLKERLFRLPMVLARSLDEFELRRQRQAALLQTQRQARRESIINRIVQAMRGSLVLAEVLQTTADLLQEALEVSQCSVVQLGERGQVGHHYVSHAAEHQHVDALLYDWFEALAHATESIQPLVISQIDATLPPALYDHALALNIQSLLIMPLVYRQACLGAICLRQCDSQRHWSDDDLATVSAIADQCAIAVHQSQLFEQTQQQARHEQVLNQIGRVLNSSLDPGFILQEIVRLTGECFQVDRAGIYQVKADGVEILNEWRLNATIPSIQGWQLNRVNWGDRPEGGATEGDSLGSLTQTIHLPNCTPDDSSHAASASSQARVLSALRSPILIRGTLFGGLVLHTLTRYRTFTPDEIRLLERIADQTAIALYNAHSYEQLENLVHERTRELEERTRELEERTRELEKEKWLSDAANRAKSEFLTHMSHELRTPLTGILGFANILNEQVFGPLTEKQTQYVEGITTCGQHLLDLINDLLDLSKIEDGKDDLYLEPVVIQEVCDACFSMIREAADKKGLQLFLTIDVNTPVCVADKRRLRQILSNLLSNAVKFTDRGFVHLSIQRVDEAIHFSVMDTGIGIAPHDQARLFQSFLQIDGGLNRKYEGTGLGLTLACKLAQLHGGEITVTSEVSKGSCFVFVLPINPDGSGAIAQ